MPMGFDDVLLGLVTLSRIAGTLIADGKRDPTPEEIGEIKENMKFAEEGWAALAPDPKPDG